MNHFFHPEAAVEFEEAVRYYRDQGRGLGAESLLLRESKGQNDLRGRFGEGLKFACITAVRLGYTPHIESSNVVIEAYASPVTMGKVEANLLTFIYKEQTKSKVGTTITVEGYTGELFMGRFTQFIGAPIFKNLKNIGRFDRQESIYDSPGGRLYVGDIYVRDIEDSEYSYNLWGLELNPDRVSEINNSDLRSQVGHLWTWVGNTELVTRILKAMTAENTFESALIWGYTPGDKIPWLEAWKKLFGERAVLFTQERLSKLAEGYGYKSVGESWPYQSKNFLRYVVPTDKAITDARSKELTAPKAIPEETLSSDQLHNLKLVRYLTDTCSSCAYKGIKPKIVPAVIPPDLRTGDMLNGLCSQDEGSIYLVGSVLQDEESALGTFYHEMGHWIGGEEAGDGTMEHTRAVQRVASTMFVIQQMHFKEIMQILGIEVPVEKVVVAPPKETPITIKEGTGPVVTRRFSVVDLDRMYSTDQLMALARERNLSTSGNKKEIAYELLGSGFVPSGEPPPPLEKTYPNIGYTPIPGVTFGIGGTERSA